MQPERTALITGASSGFGLLTAVTLARRGWRVLATMRDLNRRDRLLGAARDAGVIDRIELHALDVTNPDQIASLAVEYSARQSPLNALVNNAGIAVAGFAENVSDAELRLQFDTNFFGAAAVTGAFLPQMLRQGSGHILMVSSISGRMGFPGLGPYCASKFALEGWTETLRLEVKSSGIQVVLVEPGAYETDIWTRNSILSAQTRAVQADTQSPGARRLDRWRSKIENGNPRANPQVVADGIAAILDNPRPRLRYVFGKDAKVALLLRRYLPWSALEKLITHASGM